MNNTTYVNFSAVDYKGVDSLSSYSIPLTPLRFVPDANLDENKINIIWNFGDGTISKLFSPLKYYTYPGIYKVEMVIFDCDNNALVSTFTKTITIYDYIPFTFEINGYEHLTCPSGEISGPLKVTAYYPLYQPNTSIYCNISGSSSPNYFQIQSNKYSHLLKFNSFYDTQYNWSLSTYQFVPIKKLDFNPIGIYAKIENDTIVQCLSTDTGSVLVGSYGQKDLYFKDDSINRINLQLNFDKTKIIIPQLLQTRSYINNLGITLSANVTYNTPTELSITSNGLDGEFVKINSFDINPIKFFNTQIPFVIKIKDTNWCSIKEYDPISINNINIILLSSNNVISNSYYSISTFDIFNSAFCGYITIPKPSNIDRLENLAISANYSLTTPELGTITLSGKSTSFNLYKSNYYDIYQKNEDFDAENTIKSLRFQETLLDKEVLFGDFIGQILGDFNSDYNTIGKQIYEKISNFVENNQDLDRCEIDALNSLSELVGFNNINEEKYIFPNTVKRWVNLFSIDKNKLFGYANKFNENLDIKGRATKNEYGINIGNKIDPFTYEVDVNTPIVALEKFSNKYIVLNPYQPTNGVSSYLLSDYSPDWGWPLVLPSDFDFKSIENYYLFFEYIPQYDNTILDGVIDFENSKTTINYNLSSNDLLKSNGIYENILLDTLYQSLSLVK